MNPTDSLLENFARQTGRLPKLFQAPGRINLIGEHTDYNGGFVMPSAIDRQFLFAAAANDSNRFNLSAIDLSEHYSFSLHDLTPGHGWVHYLMGVVDGFVRRGCNVSGVDCHFTSDIPAGAGLSSSAALCSGFAFLLNSIFKCSLTTLDLALIAQESEHRFAGAKVGIMDMYASLFSKEGSVMLLDCRSLTHTYLPLRTSAYEFFLVDTKVKHSLASSAYNHRRAACEAGVDRIQKDHPHVTSLRDVSLDLLRKYQDLLSEEVYSRCRYVVEEITRTQDAAEALRREDFISFGKKMYETHHGLSKLYDVSCPESDWIVEKALHLGLAGARQMGGGFGGCVLVLADAEGKAKLIHEISANYLGVFNKEPDFYSIKLAGGVKEVDPARLREPVLPEQRV